jgi:hypothetical protein
MWLIRRLPDCGVRSTRRARCTAWRRLHCWSRSFIRDERAFTLSRTRQLEAMLQKAIGAKRGEGPRFADVCGKSNA